MCVCEVCVCEVCVVCVVCVCEVCVVCECYARIILPNLSLVLTGGGCTGIIQERGK